MEKKPAYRAPALEKGLEILEALSGTSVPQTLTQLSRSLNRSPSELFRMIGLLEKRGYIIKDNNGYYLSLKLYELAHTHSPVDHLLKAARQPMRALAIAARQSCHLSVLQHGELLVLAQEESPEKVRLSLEVGGKFPALNTVSGRILLANLDERDLDGFLETNADFLQLDKHTQAEFVKDLDEIRARGYNVAENETHIGVRDLAVPVGNPQIGVTAALTLTSLMAAGSQKELTDLLEILNDYALQITQNLGLSTNVLFPS
jgi:DNA-binding IclR family transcriptional regulator